MKQDKTVDEVALELLRQQGRRNYGISIKKPKINIARLLQYADSYKMQGGDVQFWIEDYNVCLKLNHYIDEITDTAKIIFDKFKQEFKKYIGKEPTHYPSERNPTYFPVAVIGKNLIENIELGKNRDYIQET